MRRALIGAWAIAALIGVCVAHAQAPGDATSPAVRETAQSALAYAEALDFRVSTSLIWDTDGAFNAKPEEIRASLREAKAKLAAERLRIEGVPAPVLRRTSIDLTFVGAQLRSDAMGHLDGYNAALAEVEAMVAAQAGGDCTAMNARGRAECTAREYPGSRKRGLCRCAETILPRLRWDGERHPQLFPQRGPQRRD